MSDLECPQCLHDFDYDGDQEDFTQDSEHEFVCPQCKAEFLATVYWNLHFTGEHLKPKQPEGDEK